MAGIVVRSAVAIAACLVWAAPTAAPADVSEATDQVIGPAYATLADRAADLDAAARADCAPAALRPGFHALWDAWSRIDFLRLGPVETDGRALAMHFWPDAKASGARAQQALVDTDAAAIDDPTAFAELSVALRGLAGLERLIYPSTITGDADILCRLRRATVRDLATMTAALRDEWPGFAPLLTEPGGPGNTRYLTPDEARQAIFTQIIVGLEFLADTRLGRPLGSFDSPHPERAESVLSGRGLRNVVMSLQGLRDTARALAPDAVATQSAFAQALLLAEAIDDPALAGVENPQDRLRVEILAQNVRAIRDHAEAEIGGMLGLSVGFNAKDGD